MFVIIHPKPNPESNRCCSYYFTVILTSVFVAPVVYHASHEDIDGDGVVGPTDYFVAKTFAKVSARN